MIRSQLFLGLALMAVAAPTQTFVTDAIQWRTYKAGALSAVVNENTYVIRNVGQWQQYWRTQMNLKAADAPKDVDFNTEELIAVHLGRRQSTGWNVFVDSIKKTRPGQLQLKYVEQPPARGSLTGMIITSPWVIVRMPQNSAEIRFTKEIRDNQFAPPPTGCNCACGCGDTGKCTCGGGVKG